MYLFKRYWAKRNCKHQSKAITLRLKDEIYPSAIKKYIFPISTLMRSLKKMRKQMAKIETENKFLTSIKGQNPGLNWRNLHSTIPNHFFPTWTFIQSLKKIHRKCSRKRSKTKRWRMGGHSNANIWTEGITEYPNFLKLQGIKILKTTPKYHLPTTFSFWCRG